MDWRDRLPKDITVIEDTPEGFRAKVGMPTAGDGYEGRQCPSCDRFFKIGIAEREALPDDLVMNCPYCGHAGESEEFITRVARERVDAAAKAMADQRVHAMIEDALGGAFGRGRRLRPGESGIEMSYTPATPPPVTTLPTYVEEAVRRTIQCESCGNHQGVYGAAAFCYACGPRDSAATVIEEMAAQRRALALQDQLVAELRKEAQGAGVFDKLAGDAVKYVVTGFEVYTREEFSHRAPGAAATEAARAAGRGVFQRLEDASDLFAQHGGFAFDRLVTPDVWNRLRHAFAQRHVLVHKNGHVDQPFLDQVPESDLAVGQRLVITRTEAERALDDIELLITAIEAQSAPPGAQSTSEQG